MRLTRREAGTHDRPRRPLRFVPDGTSFPVDRGELIARAEHDGADAADRRELHGLKQRRYTGLTDIIDATNLFRRKPTERSASRTAPLKGEILR